MKAPESPQRADQDADSAELLGSGHRKESTDHSIKAAHIPETDNSVLTACALTVNPHKGISWSKTIQVFILKNHRFNPLTNSTIISQTVHDIKQDRPKMNPWTGIKRRLTTKNARAIKNKLVADA